LLEKDAVKMVCIICRNIAIFYTNDDVMLKKRFPYRIPIDIHPGKLSCTNGPLDDYGEEQHLVIPVVPLPGG